MKTAHRKRISVDEYRARYAAVIADITAGMPFRVIAGKNGMTLSRVYHASYRAKAPKPAKPSPQSCKNGHPMTDDNIRFEYGVARCKSCANRNVRAYRARKKDAAVRQASDGFLEALKASVPKHDDIPAPVVQKARRVRRKAA